MSPAPPPPPIDPDDLPPDVDEHLEAAASAEVSAALRELLAAPEGVQRRATREVDRKLQSRSALSAVGEVATVGWATVLHVLTNPPGPADRTRRSEERDD